MKYAVTVAQTHSVNKAAEQLFIGQPALSRAIKELETSLGVVLFERTPRGMTLTQEGEIFVAYARSILKQVDEVESMFTSGESHKKTFSFSGPRAGYVADAFVSFCDLLPNEEKHILTYRETNSQRTIKNLVQDEYNLGVLRYAKNYEKHYAALLEEKGLSSEMVAEFQYILLMNQNHPLAKKEEIRFEDLKPYTEIAHADPYVPSLPMAQVRREEELAETDKEVFIFERATQYQLLSSNTDMFMWASPSPEKMVQAYGLVQRKCVDNTRTYMDVIIHKKDYKLTKMDNLFISELIRSKREVMQQRIL